MPSAAERAPPHDRQTNKRGAWLPLPSPPSSRSLDLADLSAAPPLRRSSDVDAVVLVVVAMARRDTAR